MSNGAIYDFDIVRFGGPTIASEASVLVDPAGTRILANDPDRILIIMTNNDAGPIYWSTLSTVDPLRAFAIGNGIATTFMVQNDGALCGVEMWAFAPAGPYRLNIVQVRRQSRG